MRPVSDLTAFKALTFDCYGTLIDWESGIVTQLAALTQRARAKGLELTDDAILDAHGRHESEQQRDTPALPYAELLAVVFARLAGEWGVAFTNSEAAAYGSSVGAWPAFPDSAEALGRLKHHYQLVILSNVDRASFAGSAERLGVAFDAVITAQDVGAYKPADRNFEVMIAALDALGTDKPHILHTAESLFHDHVPAGRFGLARCWIHRRHAKGGYGATRPPEAVPDVDFRFTSMAELADAADDAFAAASA